MGCCTCNRKMMMASLCCLISFAILSLLAMSLLQPPVDQKEELGLSFLSRYPNAKVQREFALSLEDHQNRDIEWRHALAYNEIEDTVIIGHHGLAKKYLFILEGGYVAMAKPVERNMILYPHSVFPTFTWDQMQPRRAVRMDRDHQGWGELCGCALDRVLGLYRKPTVTGRYIDSKLLYQHDYSLWGRFLHALPSHDVPVAMHAWVTGIGTRAPSTAIGKFLRMESVDKANLANLERMIEYSDVLVFDFLVDDHDRLGTHNWKVSADNKMLVWDSGLAWNYGPMHGDTEILCGTHLWNGDDPFDTPHDVKRPECKKICSFRNETIQQLRDMGPLAAPNKRLGSKLKHQLASDLLKYHFEYGIYKISRSGFFWWFYVAGRFRDQDFFDGMDYKVNILLNHVDKCIEVYGAQSVLL